MYVYVVCVSSAHGHRSHTQDKHLNIDQTLWLDTQNNVFVQLGSSIERLLIGVIACGVKVYTVN